jgi:amino-acid N-acetyltransferase
MSDSDGMAPAVRAARRADLSAVLALLADAGLPVAGVEEWIDSFVVAEDGGRIVGTAGVEVHGDDGLLRSVAVARDYRGRGLGNALTEAALARAARDGLSAVYLLTETAESFFPRHGFVRIERAAASDAVKASTEFRELCPTTAAVMVRQLPKVT